MKPNFTDEEKDFLMSELLKGATFIGAVVVIAVIGVLIFS